MPASKKDLRAAKQKANVKAGIGDANGRLPSQNKVGRLNITPWRPELPKFLPESERFKTNELCRMHL